MNETCERETDIPFTDSNERPSGIYVVDAAVESAAPVVVHAGDAVLAAVAEPKSPIPDNMWP